jgi:hypothetical protein
LSSTGTAAVPAERGGMAGGAIYTARQMGFAFGIALLGSAFTAGAHQALADRNVGSAASAARDVAAARSADLLASVPAGTRPLLDEAVHAAAVHGMVVLLTVAGIVGVAGAVISFLMIRERPGPQAADASAPRATKAPQAREAR